MKTVRIAEVGFHMHVDAHGGGIRAELRQNTFSQVVYDVRQYWGLRKLLIDVLILACHFLASNFTYQPLSG